MGQSCSLALRANGTALQSLCMQLNSLSFWDQVAQLTLPFGSSPRAVHEPTKTLTGNTQVGPSQSRNKEGANAYTAVCQEWVHALALYGLLVLANIRSFSLFLQYGGILAWLIQAEDFILFIFEWTWAFDFSSFLPELITLTNLRINFTKLHTLGDALLGRRHSDPLEKYYYAVYEMVVRGSCFCNGHASQCDPMQNLRGDVFHQSGMVRH